MSHVSPTGPCRVAPHRAGFTLVEMLVAVALTVMMLTMVVSIFGLVSQAMSNGRAGIEMNNRLRATADRLQRDLEGVTVTMRPPRRPENGEGYFEYIEGPAGAVVPPEYLFDTGAVDDNGDPIPDTTLGDIDDILMFTSRARGEEFVGRIYGSQVITSPVAEIAWFLRGATLYRRVLLVDVATVPEADLTTAASDPMRSYYEEFDISAHQQGGTEYIGPYQSQGSPTIVPNTLADLTRRENRFAHHPTQFPHDARIWGLLRLPTLRECSARQPGAQELPRVGPWPLPYYDGYVTEIPTFSRINGPIGLKLRSDPNLLSADPLIGQLAADAWADPFPWLDLDPASGTWLDYADPNATRITEDIILTNVIGFDVKAWDPGAPILETVDGTTIMPGDRGYIARLKQGGPYSPVALGAYVDLNYLAQMPDADFGVYLESVPQGVPRPDFGGATADPNGYPTNTNSQVVGTIGEPDYDPALGSVGRLSDLRASVYDTWSTHYETDGFDQDGQYQADQGTNGLDDDGLNGVDDLGEREAPPPYDAPLKGIQVKIRVFEPDTRQIREVTIAQDFTGR